MPAIMSKLATAKPILCRLSASKNSGKIVSPAAFVGGAPRFGFINEATFWAVCGRGAVWGAAEAGCCGAEVCAGEPDAEAVLPYGTVPWLLLLKDQMKGGVGGPGGAFAGS